MVPQKKGFSEKQENARNCQKLPCNRQWIDLGICDGITNSCVPDEKKLYHGANMMDGCPYNYVTENKIFDDGSF